MNKNEYNRLCFWLTFEKRIPWILLFCFFCMFVNGGYVLIITAVVYILYGLVKRSMAIDYINDLNKKRK